MKKVLIIFGFLLAVITVQGQIYSPVSWEFSQEDLGNDEIELTFKATIEGEWHLYSQDIPVDGPIPTTFDYFNTTGFEFLGAISEPDPIVEFDPNFDMTLKYFRHEAVFKQRVKTVSDSAFILKGEVIFMVCDAAQCLPPDYEEFLFTIKGIEEVVEGKDDITFIQKN